MLLEQKAEYGRTVEVLALVLHHPASEQETKARAQELLGKLEVELPVPLVAQASGQASRLDAVAAGLL